MLKLLKPSELKKLVDIQQYTLPGATVLARGTFSVVYDNHDGTVTKFTIDEASYYWLTAAGYGMDKLSEDNPFRLLNIVDHGEVGGMQLPLSKNPFGHTIYAVSMPKCDKLVMKGLDTDLTKQIRWLKKTLKEANQLSVRDEHKAKIHMSLHAERALDVTNSEEYYELAQALWYMVGDYDALPDTLHQGNIMSYDGHPVILDPVFDTELMKLTRKIRNSSVPLY